jgi:hypothetical protein
MNVKSDIAVFKGNVKTAVQMWSNDLVDELLASPVRRRNVKRFIGNWLDFQDERVNKWLDNVVLVGLDKDGNINSDLIVEEAAALFKEFDYHTTIWGFNIDISNGEAVISLPDNIATYLLFGNKSGFSFSEHDILKLKDYLKDV